MSGSASSRKPATYEDLLRVPDHLIAEILDGELVTSPRPTLEHAGVIGNLHLEVGPSLGWWILMAPELHLGPDVMVPDLAGWRRERMPNRPAGAAATLS